MALINCPECGREISDTVKQCPNCGFILKVKKKRSKMSKIIASVIILIVIAGIASFIVIQAIKKQQEELATINTTIQSLKQGVIPSQQEYDELVAKYNGLSDKDKENIEDAEILNKFQNVDIDNLSQIAQKINDMSESTSFTEIANVKKEYESLGLDEKALMDISKLTSLMELSDIENAALAACKNIKSCMKSEDSFKIKGITVKNDLDSMHFYWVLVEYSGTNSFGASVDNTSCFGITSEFEDPFFPLAQLTGVSKYLNDTSSYNEYIGCDKTEIKVDADKIAYYLDKEWLNHKFCVMLDSCHSFPYSYQRV